MTMGINKHRKILPERKAEITGMLLGQSLFDKHVNRITISLIGKNCEVLMK
jgi:hypothetical protein